jgi:predicted nucleotidyltransferase
VKFGLSELQLKEIVEFISRYSEVEEAVLFGSRAVGNYGRASDVDVAIFGQNVTNMLAQTIKLDVEEDTYLPYFFDIVAISDKTDEKLKQQVKKFGITLFKRINEQ